jgi:RimJ/RimL family protein N-acetyltransferase
MRFVPFEPETHADIVNRMATDEVRNQSFSDLPRPDRPIIAFMVQKDNGQWVGWVSAYNIDEINKKCEVGIAFPAKSGLALVYPAAKKFQSILFEDCMFHRIHSRVLVGNGNAVRLNEWLGLKQEGIERETYLVKGVFKDAAIYGMTIQDYERRWPNGSSYGSVRFVRNGEFGADRK